MAVVSKDGKKSELTYKVIKKFEKNAWVEVELLTGRYHQIRAQFSAIGSPIVNDTRYGAKKITQGDEIPLIHVSSCFVHPVTKEKLELKHPDFLNDPTVFWEKTK
jgi:23S rRNA pseudouridine1911/1915/1917 synthase